VIAHTVVTGLQFALCGDALGIPQRPSESPTSRSLHGMPIDRTPHWSTISLNLYS